MTKLSCNECSFYLMLFCGFLKLKVDKDTLNPARFDFYLPKLNILLEYDGIQHFKQGHWEPLEKIQERDAYKTQWCKDNNITLIRIPYTDYTKLTTEYLLNLIEEAH